PCRASILACVTRPPLPARICLSLDPGHQAVVAAHAARLALHLAPAPAHHTAAVREAVPPDLFLPPAPHSRDHPHRSSPSFACCSCCPCCCCCAARQRCTAVRQRSHSGCSSSWLRSQSSAMRARICCSSSRSGRSRSLSSRPFLMAEVDVLAVILQRP